MTGTFSGIVLRALITSAVLIVSACVVSSSPKQASDALAPAETYPVELVFVAESGERIADIPVEVIDGQNRKIFKDHINGHILNLVLPKGEYRVIATLGERTMTKNIYVKAGPLREMFVW